jgi:hypothetical protein
LYQPQDFHLRSDQMKKILLLISFFAVIDSAEAQWWRCHQNTGSLCAPAVISLQPVSPPSICPDGIVLLAVSVSGTGPFTFQWFENSSALTDGGPYSGTATSELTISNPGYLLDGNIYRCTVTNCSGHSVSSAGATLSIHTLPADINKDGVTDNNDFSLLNLVYNTSCGNCPEDLNADGTIDVKDFLTLLGEFNLSCH